DAANADDPSIVPAIGEGEFGPLMVWLRQAVHAQGSRLSTEELLVEVTGRPLGTDAFKAHLRRRYLDS
ncbi:MAG: carboxypeptidase M32, partial [Pseudomonadota bacterium]